MALQQYLTSGKLAAPVVVDSAESIGPVGFVATNLKTGEIFLKSDNGRAYRLRWDAADKQRRRSLPAGRYAYIGYRLIDGKWMLSTTSNGRRKVVVRAGGTLQLDVEPAVHFNLRAKQMHGKLRLMMGIFNDKHQGLSIYHEGKRLPIPFEVAGGAGKPLASGKMQYG